MSVGLWKHCRIYLKVSSTWKTFIFKHGLLILLLLTSVHHWYSLCQRWSHGFEDKGNGTMWIQPKPWRILGFLDTSLPVCQGERWLLWFLAAVSLWVIFFFSGLVAIRMKSCLNIKDDLHFISKPFDNFSLFKSNNFNLLVEISFWTNFFSRAKYGLISVIVQKIPLIFAWKNEWET